MNEDDKITWADRSSRVPLTCASIHVNCTEQYMNGQELTMRDEVSRLGRCSVRELSEATCSHRPLKRIRRGIVWHVTYGVRLIHPGGLAASPSGLKSCEQAPVSSFPMTPYTLTR